MQKGNKNLSGVKIVRSYEIGKNEGFKILLNHAVKFLKRRR